LFLGQLGEVHKDGGYGVIPLKCNCGQDARNKRRPLSRDGRGSMRQARQTYCAYSDFASLVFFDRSADCYWEALGWSCWIMRFSRS
jgi:hypothetical protein